MKTTSLICAALCVATILSCNQKQGPEQENLIPPEGTFVSTTYEFAEEASPVRSLELTSDHHYVAQLVLQTRADDGEPVFKTGTWKLENSVYALEGLGTMTVSGEGKNKTAVLNLLDGRQVTLSASVTEDGVKGNIYGFWDAGSLIVSAQTGNNPAVAKSFPRCSAKDAVEYFQAKGFNVSGISSLDGDLDGYTIKEVAFTASGTFVITFESVDPYVGKWNWKDEQAGTIFYDLSVSGKTGKILTRTGEATIAQKDGGCSMTIPISYKGYKIDVTVNLYK